MRASWTSTWQLFLPYLFTASMLGGCGKSKVQTLVVQGAALTELSDPDDQSKVVKLQQALLNSFANRTNASALPVSGECISKSRALRITVIPAASDKVFRCLPDNGLFSDFLDVSGAPDGEVPLRIEYTTDLLNTVYETTATTNKRTTELPLFSIPELSESNGVASLNPVQGAASYKVTVKETNGTAVLQVTVSAPEVDISILTVGVPYKIHVSAIDVAGNEFPATNDGSRAWTRAGQVPPSATSHLITLAPVTPTSISVSWIKATDDLTPQNQLSYKIVYSSENNIQSAEAALANGTTARDWATDIASTTANGLTAGQTYFFNVLVRDQAQNMRAYTSAAKTIDAGNTTMTASSHERKTFYDSASAKHWAFWFSGSKVIYGFSSDGVTFTESSGGLSVTTPRFTVTSKSSLVLIAYESNFDVVIQRGTIASDAITWDTAVIALDASGAANTYIRPAMTIGTDDRVYVAAFQQTAGVFTPKVSRSDAAYSGTLSWPAASVAGEPTSIPDGLALVPVGSNVMALASTTSGAVQSYEFDGTTWTAKTGSVKDWWPLAKFTTELKLSAQGEDEDANPIEVPGYITTALVAGSTIYVGGFFDSIGGVSGVRNIAKWDGHRWQPVIIGGNLTNVYSLAISGDSLFIGSAGGIVKWDLNATDSSGLTGLGSGLSHDDPDSEPSVYALVIADNTLYVGGDFNGAGPIQTNHIAKWDLASSSDDNNGWSAVGNGSPVGVVNELLLSGATLYVGGTGIAKWDINGSDHTAWSTLGSGVSGAVYALAVSGGDLYVGGTFLTAGGKPASRVAKWGLSGTGNTDWTALGSGVDGPVTSMAAKGSELYVSGSFNSAGGKSAAAIAKWNTWASNDSGWSALGTGISGSSPPAGIFVLGSELVVFGQSLIVTGVNVGSIAKWNTAATDNSGWSGWSDGGKIMAIATSGSNIYVGGQFNAIGGITASNIAMWNGTAWSALGTGLNGPVNALALHGLNLYAGGTLSISYLDENYDLAYSYGIAKWNGTSWSRLGSGLDASVHALALSGSTLYVGGDFTNNASNPVSYIASWNTAASDDSGWAALDSGLNGPVRALITSGTDLYAGGEFTSASGTQANLIAKWNGSTWSALGDGLAGESVRALAISGSDLYAAGKFGTSNGIALNNIAKWDGSAWDALGTGVIGQVNAMAISGLDLFVGGEFIRSGRSNLAKWTLGSSTDIGWSSAAIDVNSDPVFALTAAGATIYQGSAGKMSRWATNLVASVTSFSATGDSSGAYLAYVSRTNLRPNLTSFTAGAWGTTPLQLSTNTVSPSISLGMAPDTFGTGTAKWVVAWERNGNIEYRAMRLGTLTKVTTRASGSNNYNPSLPESILTNFIPVIWTKGSTSPYQLNANIISVTP